MAITFNRTILLRGQRNVFEDVAKTGEAIKPGMLLKRVAVSGAPTVKKHDTAGGRGSVLVALENTLGAGGTVDTVYADGDQVRYHAAKGGDVLNLLQKAGTNLAIGGAVVSDGAGRIEPQASLSTTALFQQAQGEALVASDLTGGGAVDTLVPVLIW